MINCARSPTSLAETSSLSAPFSEFAKDSEQFGNSQNLSIPETCELNNHKNQDDEEVQKESVSPFSVSVPHEIQRTTDFSKNSQGAQELSAKKYRSNSCFARSPQPECVEKSRPLTPVPALSTSKLLDTHPMDNGSLFLLRPQRITANIGETAVFSCVIRPPPEAPKICRVSWRHKNVEIDQGQGKSPRVTVKANNPYNGVFQLKLTNITECDHGDYEVVALDENDAEICSATFHLSVDSKSHGC